METLREKQLETDVLIVGAGGAGLRAAIEIKNRRRITGSGRSGLAISLFLPTSTVPVSFLGNMGALRGGGGFDEVLHQILS